MERSRDFTLFRSRFVIEVELVLNYAGTAPASQTSLMYAETRRRFNQHAFGSFETTTSELYLEHCDVCIHQ